MESTVYPSLRGRRVLITGGASGIGASLVENFVSQGARVAFIDRDADAASTLLDAVSRRGGVTPTFSDCDLLDVPAMRRAILALGREWGPFEVLVNNAARDDRHRLQDLEPYELDQCLRINVGHQIFAAQTVAPGMRVNGGGSIIMLGSVAWMLGNVGYIGYAAAKAAVHGATRSLARELGGDSIRVNSIVPGLVMTERQTRWFTPDALAAHVARQCLPYTLVPDDIARMALFLAADDSRGCTGQDFIVDAGVS